MDHSKRYENTLVAILFFTWGTVFLDRMSQLYLAPYIVPEFHLTHAQAGMLASVLAITWAISTLVFGALSDRIGRRPILIPAVFAFSNLSWLSGIAHHPSALCEWGLQRHWPHSNQTNPAQKAFANRFII
jgi:MFS family permease